MSEQPVIRQQAPTVAPPGPPPMPQTRPAPQTGPGPSVARTGPDAPAPSLTSGPSAGSAIAAPYPWYLRFSWVLALVVGILAYVATFVIMLLTRNPTMLPTVLLVGAATIPLTVLLFAQSSKVGPLVPTRTVLVTVALGGLFGICAAGLGETIAGLLLGKASILLVGVIEETAKLVVPLIVLGLAHRSTRGGGIVIGIAAGTGFAVLETMGYGFNALLSRSGGLGALDSTLILRGILVPAGHVAWTGAICAALWFLVETSHKLRGVLSLAVAYVGAIVMHTAWDATTSGLLHILIGVISVGTLLTLTILAHRAFVRRSLAPTGAPGAEVHPADGQASGIRSADIQPPNREYRDPSSR